MAKGGEITYAHGKGVSNTRTRSATDASLKDMHRDPVAVKVSAADYARLTKRERGEVKQSLPYFVGGTLKGKRQDDNVTARTLLTLDIEAKDGQEEQPPSPQEVFDTLDSLGAEGWVYTSLSHTADAPRYRVVLPLLEPLEGDALKTEALKATTQAAAKKLNLLPWCTPESWVLSQPMFLPAKLKGGVFWQNVTTGKRWRTISSSPVEKEIADIPDQPLDPVLYALQRAGLYLREDAKHKGMHFFTCSFADEHGAENETQTVYFEAHHDGNPRPAVKCFDTDPDEDGRPHLTYKILVNWLREHKHLRATDENADTTTALEDQAEFWASTSIEHMLANEPRPLEFVFEKFAPVGRLIVLGGPGGVSKSALALRLLLAASTGGEFGPFKADKPMRCMYLSYEDDAQTFHIRLRAMYDALNDSAEGLLYDMDLVRKNLRIRAVADDAARWVLMRKQGHNGTPQATERMQWLADLLRDNRVRLLVIDPVAYVHLLEENDAGEMKALQQALNGIAQYAQCAILALHHMQKAALWASIDDINQGSLRGASSIADNARSVGVLVSMPQKDAGDFGLPATHDTVSRYAVFKHVKANFSGSLGVHVFERRGPLLMPTELRPLAPDERQHLKEERAEAKRETKVDLKKISLIEWLADRPAQSAAQIDKGFFRGAKDRHGVRVACIEEGLIDAPDPAPGKARQHTVTARGLEYINGG
jgi:hypothetical protein